MKPKANVWKHLFGLVLLFIPLHISAQKFIFSKNHWHQGEITLKTGETLQGLVKYHLEHDLVELQSENTTKTFGSTLLESFSFIDTLTKVERVFYSLPTSTQTGYKTYHLYEVIGEGDFAILTREKVVMKPHNKGRELKGTGKYDLVLEDSFYYLDKDGIVKHCGKINDLAGLLDVSSTDLKQYIKTNKVNMTKRNDFMNMITYYSIYTKKFSIKSRTSLGE
jgi:phage antirepressor YoqD-like protein